MAKQRVLIMGAAGRDFHNFNTVFRDDDRYEVVAFTATQIPNIEGRRYPPELAGKRYPQGIPIYPESELTTLIRTLDVDQVVFAYSDVSHQYVMTKAATAIAAGADFRLIGPKETMLTSKKPVVAVCAKIEAELADLDEADKQAFLADLGLEEPGLNRLIRAAYDLLGLQTYFTAGVKEVRAWTIRKGDTAPRAAGVIHSDFEKGFIRAQTIAFEDFIACKGEQGAREAGKQRAEGKDYVVRDGDVLNFLFNV